MSTELFRDEYRIGEAYVLGCSVYIDDHVNSHGSFPIFDPDYMLLFSLLEIEVKGPWQSGKAVQNGVFLDSVAVLSKIGRGEFREGDLVHGLGPRTAVKGVLRKSFSL